MFRRLLLFFTLAVFISGAGNNNTDTDIMPDSPEGVAQLRNAIDTHILAIIQHDEIDPTIHKIRTMINNSAHHSHPTIQLYRAVLGTIPVLKGIIWRLGMIAAQNDAIYLSAMHLLRGIKYRSYLYGPHIDALFDYVNLPNLEVERFETVSQFQDFLVGPFADAFEKALAVIYQLQKAEDKDLVFKVNMQIFTGKGRFLAPQNMQLKFVKPFLYYIAHQLEIGLATTYLFSAYDLDKLFPFLNRIAKNSLVNSHYTVMKNLLFSQSDFNLHIHTPKEVAQVLKRAEFKDFLVMRGESSSAHLKMSLERFRAANDSLIKAYQTVPGITGDPATYVFNHEIVAALSAEVMPHLLERQKLFAGPTKLISSVTGDRIKIDVSALFKPKKDLKTFYPVAFKAVPDHYLIQRETGKITLPPVYVWNYDYGQPTKWPDPTFDGFLPEATNKNFYEVLRTVVLTPSTSVFAPFLPVPSMAIPQNL